MASATTDMAANDPAIVTAIPGVADVAGAADRVGFVDVTRGILILLMTSSHAIGQAHVSAQSFFTSAWWLPQGWSTPGFIALSGFTAALLMGTPEQSGRRASRRIARAGELLVVMVVSNMLFRAARIALGLYDAEDLDWSHLMLPAHSSYSISGVLLPTAILLVLSAFALPAVHRVSLPIVVSALTVLAFGVELLSHLAPHTPWGDALTFVATIHLGEVPIFRLVGCGMLGLGLGILWQSSLSQRAIIAITLVLAVVPALPLLPESTAVTIVHETLFGISHLVALLACALLLLRLPAAGPLVRGLDAVGRYGLFCFLGHRLLLGVAVASHVTRVLPAEVVYSLYIASAMGILIAVCSARRAWPGLDRGLRAVYL